MRSSSTHIVVDRQRHFRRRRRPRTSSHDLCLGWVVRLWDKKFYVTIISGRSGEGFVSQTPTRSLETKRRVSVSHAIFVQCVTVLNSIGVTSSRCLTSCSRHCFSLGNELSQSGQDELDQGIVVPV